MLFNKYREEVVMKKGLKRFLIGLLVIGLILFVLFCILIGIVIVEDNKQEKLLDEEVNMLLNVDLLEDNIDMTIVSDDEYGVIEKTIKKYLKDYSDNYKSYIKTLEEFEFSEMFTASTFKNDGPDFLNSKNKLSKLQKDVNNSLDSLIEMSSEKYIMSLIEKKDLTEYSVDLYKEYMMGTDVNSFNDIISDDVADMKKISIYVNLFLDDCYAIYDFMSKNRSSWNVDESANAVYFSNNELVSEYNSLLNKIIEDYNNLAIEEDDDVEDCF